jgi:hypothetical protein
VLELTARESERPLERIPADKPESAKWVQVAAFQQPDDIAEGQLAEPVVVALPEWVAVVFPEEAAHHHALASTASLDTLDTQPSSE